MQSSRDNKKDDDQSKSSISGRLFYKAVYLIQYPIKHPFKTIFYICLGSAVIQQRRSFALKKSDAGIKYPIDSLHMAYSGPSVLSFRDRNFNPIHDLVGWTTDSHPARYRIAEGKWDHLHSFHTDTLPEKENRSLIEGRYSFYKTCYHKFNYEGYGNILSHRSENPEGTGGQGAFGFFGFPTIESLYRYDSSGKGFIVGIRAFGNENYYSSVNNNTYQLAKIDLNTIDLDKINPLEHNNLESNIAHVYLKNDKVQQYPDRCELKNTFCKDGWSLVCYENYIKNLPNFSNTVDWVIKSSDLPAALQGKFVINMMDHKEINILEWQKKQQRKGQQRLGKYSIFALPRPSDYDYSFERDEISGQFKKKSPIHFKIGKK